MTNNGAKYHSLSRRIVSQFCVFTLALSAIFGLLCFVLLYNLEDGFIEREIAQEADYLYSQYLKSNQWPELRSPHFSLHFSKSTLPADIREQARAEPRRNEFYGEQGRHYHLHSFPDVENTYLLAEVSQKLLVRPVRDGVIKLLFISASILTIIACFIAWRLGRKTAKPLKELAELVDGVAPENIPNTFADKFPNNEIGILAKTLENSMKQIAKALARERCFTRDVSHELRTPVAVIKNSSELFSNKYGHHAKGAELFNRIHDASLQMEQTVTTLLHLAREEHSQASQATVSLLPLVEDAIIKHSYLLEGKDVEVKVNDNCNTKIVIQQGMLTVLLDNLLSNAFQYTEQER